MMLWRLKQKLTRIGRRANPDQALKLEMYQFFQDKGYFAKQKTSFTSYHFGVYRFVAAASLCILVVALSTASYAYASDDVLPDSVFYPVREKIEALEERLAANEQQKQEVLVRHQERRLKEAKILITRQKPLPTLHKVLLVEVKKEEQEERPPQMVDTALPLVKARLEVKAELLREQQQAKKKARREIQQAEKQAQQEQKEEKRQEKQQERQERQEQRKQEKLLKQQDRQEQAEQAERQGASKKTMLDKLDEVKFNASGELPLTSEEKDELVQELTQRQEKLKALREARQQERLRARLKARLLKQEQEKKPEEE